MSDQQWEPQWIDAVNKPLTSHTGPVICWGRDENNSHPYFEVCSWDDRWGWSGRCEPQFWCTLPEPPGEGE